MVIESCDSSILNGQGKPDRNEENQNEIAKRGAAQKKCNPENITGGHYKRDRPKLRVRIKEDRKPVKETRIAGPRHERGPIHERRQMAIRKRQYADKQESACQDKQKPLSPP
jgi:hypothetical protein